MPQLEAVTCKKNMRKETEEKYPEASGTHPRDELQNYLPDPSSTIIFTKKSVGRCIAN